MFDWNSFWVNIYAGLIYFILGILLSIWLIPKYTLRLINNRNKKYLKQKTSFTISELCSFFNRMPQEFKVNNEVRTIHSSNLKYKDLSDFVSILSPDLLKPAAIEETYLRIIESALQSKAIDRYELMKDEIEG
jgi:hypothetical protein